MADDVAFVGVSWQDGWLHFVITPDSHVAPTGYAQKVDQARENQVNLSTADFPPGFTQTDRNALENLLAKLAAEWSKAAIGAAAVTLVDRVFWEVGFEPQAEPAAAEQDSDG